MDFSGINSRYEMYSRIRDRRAYVALLEYCFENLWHYYRGLRNGGSRISEDDAYDLAMDLVERIGTSLIEGDRQYQNFAGYWFRVSKNRYIRFHKDLLRQQSTPGEMLDFFDQLSGGEAADARDDRSRYLDQNFRKTFRQVLCGKERQVMLLVLEGATNRAISERLEITTNYVGTIKNRALEKLKVHFRTSHDWRNT